MVGATLSTVWVGRVVAVIAAGAILGAACSSSHDPTVTLGCCRDGVVQTSYVASQLRNKCPTDTGQVTLNLSPFGFRHTFDCRKVRGPLTAVTAMLAGVVADTNGAAQRVDRVIALQRSLGVPPMPRDDAIWGFALSPQLLNCVHAADVPYHRSQITESGQTAVQWLTVEAAIVGGACPDRLPALYQSVTAAGQPQAVAVVEAESSSIKLS
jgi:hypothetical protein